MGDYFSEGPSRSKLQGQSADKRSSGRGGAGGRQLRQDKMAREDEAGRRRTAALLTVSCVGCMPLAAQRWQRSIVGANCITVTGN